MTIFDSTMIGDSNNCPGLADRDYEVVGEEVIGLCVRPTRSFD